MYSVATVIDECSRQSLNRQLAQISRLSGMGLRVDHRTQIENFAEIVEYDFFIADPALMPRDLRSLVERLKSLKPSARVLIYADKSDYKTVTSLLKAGIAGYVLKSCPVFELAHALESMIMGGVPLSPQVSPLVLQGFLTNSVAQSLPILTKREKQIFECLEEGNSYKGISLRFNISQNTVHSHVKNIYSKLNAVNKFDAFAKARDMAAA